MLNHEALGHDLDRLALITQPFINICAAAEILHDFPTDEMVEAGARYLANANGLILDWENYSNSVHNEHARQARIVLNAVRDLIFE